MADRELLAVFHCVQYWSVHENHPETIQKELEHQEKARQNPQVCWWFGSKNVFKRVH